MTTYANPVVRGNAPDPSIVRVRDDYYLVTSTFDFMPGIQIWHSTNLVDWTLLGGAVTRPAQYRRDGRPGPVMLFAATIRFAEGVFYIVSTNVADDQGNFVISASDPAGEWSDAVWIDTHAFDPSLLYDERTWYYTRRTLAPRADGQLGPVVQAEIDMTTGELGEMRELMSNYGGFSSNDIEGPHLYRVGEWYYLFSAEGSTWKGHMQTCARSRSPWGPFEPAPHNPVITHRHRVGHPIQTLGHADLVEAADGRWWAVSHGTRHEARGGFVYHHNLGRETLLIPVEWTADGWPVVGVEGTTELTVTVDRPLPSGGATPSVAPTLWTEGWTTLDTTMAGAERLAPDLISVAHGADLESSTTVGALFQTQREDATVFGATMTEIPDAPAAAGIAVYSDALHHYSVLLSRQPDGSVSSVVRRVADDLVARTSSPVLSTSPRLVIRATAETYEFDVDGVTVGSGSARLLSAETVEAFVGARFAIVAVGTTGSTTFSHIHYQ